MKRSEINRAIETALDVLARHGWALPDWAGWDAADHAREPQLSRWLRARQIGWDVTDFAQGDFARRGLTLFCVRNGSPDDPEEVPYAEKLLFVGVDQETPFHAHKVKIEDIILRGGGRLAVEFSRAGSFGEPCEVSVDGRTVDAFAGPLLLSPGQSVRIPRGLQHRFWADGKPAFVAEVSQTNDDLRDNYFLDEFPRFTSIEEDEVPVRLLWSDVAPSS